MGPNGSTEDRWSAEESLRDRLIHSWRSVRWPALVASAVAASVLGYLGFRQHFDEEGASRSATDVAYLTLQLFTLQSGSVSAETPWQLEMARLLAPAVGATAIVTALAVAFREQIADLRLRRAHDHVIIGGLGSTGAQLARGLVGRDYRVVGIDIDVSTPGASVLRQRGVSVIVGDARDVDTLKRARVDRASHVICLTGGDDSNAEMALQAAIAVGDRAGPKLTCLAHIRDPDLCLLMRSEELAAAQRGGARLDFFNIEDQGARALIAEYPPFPINEGVDPAAPRILVVGLNRLGESLVVELARQWRTHPAAAARSLGITVIDPNAIELAEQLRRRYPQLEHAACIDTVDAPLDPLDPASVSCADWAIAYVCIDADSTALQAALTVRHRLEPSDTLVVVEFVRSQGLAHLVDRPHHRDHIRSFNLLDHTLSAELLLGGTYELLARAIHQTYLDEQHESGATAATNPSIVPWEQLPDSLKESNRRQAAHIGTKLAAIGRGIGPLTDWDADKTTFTPDEVELLAEMEHDRWVTQRRSAGWTPGPKDIEAKTTPHLVPWNELTDDVKEWDRHAVRDIPAFLARAGYQTVSPTQGATPGRPVHSR